jgi:hypothetical protein
MSQDHSHSCLVCVHALRDPAAPVDQILTGKVQHMCLESPPTVIAIPTQQGLATMTVYPLVTGETVSCSRFKPAKVVQDTSRELS